MGLGHVSFQLHSARELAFFLLDAGESTYVTQGLGRRLEMHLVQAATIRDRIAYLVEAVTG